MGSTLPADPGAACSAGPILSDLRWRASNPCRYLVPPMDTIYLDGRHYDRMFPGKAEIPFLLEQARRCGGPVLELACGNYDGSPLRSDSSRQIYIVERQ